MKKRIVSLFLAALMIATLVPTAAFAAEDADVMPYSAYCPVCQEGYMRMTRTEVSRSFDRRVECPHDPEGRYNCAIWTIQYRCEERCEDCGFASGNVYYEYRDVWVHDACPCH